MSTSISNQQSKISNFHMRRARQEDAPAIRALIHEVGINPTALDWRRFLLAVTPVSQGVTPVSQGISADRMIGCGQVKPHGDGTRELASIAVVADYRGQGVARALIERLMAENPPPLYLTCRSTLGPFYAKFGFRRVAEEEAPPYFQRILRLVKVMRVFSVSLWVMKWEGYSENRE